MELKDQVASLELSKRLKELGVNQQSLFYWHEEYGDYRIYRFGMIAENLNDLDKDDISAFTVAELGNLLPQTIGMDRWTGGWSMRTLDSKRCNYTDGETEAEARAKMLIYLLENKLI